MNTPNKVQLRTYDYAELRERLVSNQELQGRVIHGIEQHPFVWSCKITAEAITVQPTRASTLQRDSEKAIDLFVFEFLSGISHRAFKHTLVKEAATT